MVNVHTLVGHEDSVVAVAITPDGKYAVSASDDKTLKLWDLHSGSCVRTFAGHESSVASVAIIPDTGHAVSVSNDKTLKLWDLNTGNCLTTWGGESSLICCAVSSKGTPLVTGEASGRVHILSLEGMK
ncbi:WD40 repeat domain-containing protein [Scytonema sp. NUACC21]